MTPRKDGEHEWELEQGRRESRRSSPKAVGSIPTQFPPVLANTGAAAIYDMPA